MNLELIESCVSAEKLYELVSEEAIFSYYLNVEIRPSKKYVNPFRNDGHAGCFFMRGPSGTLLFVDFASSDKTHYNAIDIAKLATGINDYRKVVIRIKNDLLFKKTTTEAITKSLDSKNKIVAYNHRSDIKVKLTKFNKSDFDYWEAFGITEEILKFYDVKKVHTAWINGVSWYLYSNIDPCYRYKEKGRFKLYRPLTSNKKNKFRSNLFGGILEGYNQLPQSGEKLIITKGRKDVMTLHSIGINAVAVRSENTPISQNAFDLLKERFNEIYLWFDADEAGINGAAKMSNVFKIPMITHDAKFGKDPSDIYKAKGKSFLINTIIESINNIKNNVR